ncbi:MAG: hypothetical protein OEY01_13185 [Desulfobulbaceae bacterium]|nr:hypothetical protein [Desulfobulbaceae bacterium]HIJ79683.1 hypothetical protein [Deltaproteobacteria bacterium]
MKKNKTITGCLFIIFALFRPGALQAEEYRPTSFPDTPFLGFEQAQNNSSPPLLAIANLVFKEFNALQPIRNALDKTEKIIDHAARKAKLKGDIYLSNSNYQKNDTGNHARPKQPFPISWNSKFRPDGNVLILNIKSGDRLRLEGQAGEDGYQAKFLFHYDF